MNKETSACRALLRATADVALLAMFGTMSVGDLGYDDTVDRVMAHAPKVQTPSSEPALSKTPSKKERERDRDRDRDRDKEREIGEHLLALLSSSPQPQNTCW